MFFSIRNQANQKDPEAYKLSQTAQKRRHASLQSSHREEVHTEVEKALQAVGELFVTFRPCHTLKRFPPALVLTLASCALCS